VAEVKDVEPHQLARLKRSIGCKLDHCDGRSRT
jgi:hypothetical protein